MRFELSSDVEDVRVGDICVFRLETKTTVKWLCGKVRTFVMGENPGLSGEIVLSTGKIPEFDGYGFVCCIHPVPDAIQLSIDGEVTQ